MFTLTSHKTPASAVIPRRISEKGKNQNTESTHRSGIDFNWNNVPIQPKLKVNKPGDKYELEADRIAEKVVSMDNIDSIKESGDSGLQRKLLAEEITTGATAVLHRKYSKCKEEEEETMLQRKENTGSTSGVSEAFQSHLNSFRGSGKMMDRQTNQSMSSKFGVDFSRVKIHDDAKAAQLSQSINAKAFTLGNDIYFNHGQYQPQSKNGKGLLAHELVHTVQQRESQKKIQRSLGDGHDLASPRFSRDNILEEIYDGNQQLNRGDTGEAVSKIQHALQDLGIFLRFFGVDGEFGGETETKVRAYQVRKGITTDPNGVVGVETITVLDNEFASVTDNPMTLSQNPADINCIHEILCPWNSAIIEDFKSGSRRVIFVDRLFWADERFDGNNWVPNPMEGAGETTGNTIRLVISKDCENVAQTLYHEYLHTRSPARLASKPWADEEDMAYSLETSWSIARGITPDPSLVTTDALTGETILDPTGVDSHVATYPGMVSGVDEEVVAKVGSHRVRVRRGIGSIYIRDAIVGDTIPGRRITVNPQVISRNNWPTCP